MEKYLLRLKVIQEFYFLSVFRYSSNIFPIDTMII
jgi:hypothetical protein